MHGFKPKVAFRCSQLDERSQLVWMRVGFDEEWVNSPAPPASSSFIPLRVEARFNEDCC